MKQIVDVNVGQVRIGKREAVLRATALGSCIGLAAYDRYGGIGAVAHIMLPGRAPEQCAEPARYAADAVDRAIARMAGAGAITEGIEVCLVGAGNVLEREDDTICRDNIDSVLEILYGKCIRVRASLLGGISRKAVELDVATGRVLCSKGDGRDVLLWDLSRG